MLQFPLLLAAESTWGTALIDLDQDQRFVVLLAALGCATGVIIAVTSIVAGVYASLTRRRHEMELKQDMLDRGMSAEEIVEVIKAAPVEDAASRWVEGWQKKRKA